MILKGIQLLTVCLAVCISVGNARAPKKIVHGQAANEREFPYQVALMINGTKFCSGSIILANYILTAAHCIYGEDNRIFSPANINVLTGIIDVGMQPDDDNIFHVSGVFPHPAYLATVYPKVNALADIALLKLDRSITFNNHRQMIPLPEYQTDPGTQAIISGWGAPAFAENSHTVRYLQKLQMTTMDLNQCVRLYQFRNVNDGNVCAIGNVQPSGICQGDSGGPLVAGGEVIGVTSWSAECAEGFPDVFTSVHYYKGWIIDVVRET